MRTRITMAICLYLPSANRASVQWIVSDSSNLAQGIINAPKNIIHTSKTATNMVSNFQGTVKIYQQGKKYYDALKSVNNLVKDAHRVQQTILMTGSITDIYANSFQRMLHDGDFRPGEFFAIALDYTKLLEESNEISTKPRNVVNITTPSMTDKGRMDVVERYHSGVKCYCDLASYYTSKNISTSYLRARKKNDLDCVMELYGNMNKKCQQPMKFDNLCQISHSFYEQMTPPCGDIVGVARGIAGLSVLLYVIHRVR